MKKRIQNWNTKQGHVKAAIQYIATSRHMTPERLIAWDAKHGKRLFCWDQNRAAIEFRLWQARRFLNHMAYLIDKVRVHRVYSVTDHAARAEGNRDARVYIGVRDVINSAARRAEVIHMLTAKMATIAKELAFFKLSKVEMREIVTKLELAMEGQLFDNPVAS